MRTLVSRGERVPFPPPPPSPAKSAPSINGTSIADGRTRATMRIRESPYIRYRYGISKILCFSLATNRNSISARSRATNANDGGDTKLHSQGDLRNRSTDIRGDPDFPLMADSLGNFKRFPFRNYEQPRHFDIKISSQNDLRNLPLASDTVSLEHPVYRRAASSIMMRIPDFK